MPPPRKHKPGYTRSKSGCLTCREKRVKCDEIHPKCSRCDRLELTCQWANPAVAAGNPDRIHDAENTGAPPGMTRIIATGSFDLTAGVGPSGYDVRATSSDGRGCGDGQCGGGGERATSSTSITSGVSLQQLEKLGDYNRHDVNSAGIAEGSIQSELQETPHGSEYNIEPNYLVDELELLFGKQADKSVKAVALANTSARNRAVWREW